MKRSTNSFYRASVLAMIAVAVSTSDAANRSWTNAAGGSWEVPGNWNPNGTPTNTDSIRITANGTYDVNFNNTTADTGDSNGWLTVFETLIQGDGVGGVPTLLVDFTNTAKQLTITYTGGDALQINTGGNLQLNNGTIALPGGMQVGLGSTGTLQVAGGTLGINSATIGSKGTLTVSAGSFTNPGFFVVDGRYIILGGSNSANSITIANGASAVATILQNGGTFNMTGTLTIGNSGNGTMIVSNGAFNVNNINMGDNPGGIGTWSMFGGTSTVSGALNLGTASGSTGTVVVAGGRLDTTAGSMAIGSTGTGFLIVSNGTFNSAALTVNSRGAFTVAGGNYSGTSGNLSGLWNISGGSSVLSSSLTLGNGSGQTGTIVQTGGTLAVTNNTIYLSNSGRGIYNQSGGTLLANNISMGDNSNAQGGDWTITGGTGSLSGTFRVGNQGNVTSTVTIANSGLLELRSSTTLGHASAGFGSITNRDGGTLRFTGQNNPTITINTGSTAILQNATLEFKDASAASLSGNITQITQVGDNTLSMNHASNSLVASYTFKTNNGQNFAFLKLSNGGAFLGTSVTVDSGGRITGDGLVSGSVDVKARGTLSPGNSFGTLTVGNGLTMQSNSVLQLDIGPVQYDQIVVIGSVNLSNSILQITPTASISSGTFTIVDNDGAGDATLGTFQGLTNNAFIDASANGFDAYFVIQYNAGDGNNVVLLGTVPEPSGLALALVAFLALGKYRRSGTR